MSTDRPEPPRPVPAPPAAAATPDRPPPVPEDPARRTTRIVIRVVVWVFVAIAAISALIGALAVVAGRMGAERARMTCQTNLSQLAGVFVGAQTESPARPLRSGPALLLEWRKSQRRIREYQEVVLLCPNHVDRADPTIERHLWDDADLDDPDPRLCSYAVRDFEHFPLPRDPSSTEPIFACLHHGRASSGGAIVAFSDGSARFIEYEELGIESREELVTGPDSKAEVLRPLLSAGPPPGRGSSGR